MNNRKKKDEFCISLSKDFLIDGKSLGSRKIMESLLTACFFSGTSSAAKQKLCKSSKAYRMSFFAVVMRY